MPGSAAVGALLAGATAGLLGGDPRPVFAAAGSLTLFTVAVAWSAGRDAASGRDAATGRDAAPDR